MNYLAFDTSTVQASIALSIDGVVLTKTESEIRQHAKCLLPMIDDLLLEAGLSLQALHGIVFGCGPGSFTGLRIASSVAQGLAYANDTPLYRVSSLDAIAFAAFQTEIKDTGVFVMLDARMQEVYWAYYPNNHSEAQAHVSKASEIEVPGDGPLIIAGVDFAPYVPALAKPIQTRVVQQQTHFPEALTMIRLVESGRALKVTPEEALPTYIRHHVTQGKSHG